MTLSRRTLAIVVDASVGQAAGTEDAVADRAIACRDALKAILQNEMRLVISQVIKREWKDHWSTYGRKWFYEMTARKRTHKVDEVDLPDVVAVIGGLRLERDRLAATKDLHLIGAAMQSDRRVISLDAKARALFVEVGVSVAWVRTIHWGNPEERLTGDWLRSGCPRGWTDLLLA